MLIKAININLCCLAIIFNLIGQPPMNRYTSALFSGYTETTNILFSQNVPQPNPGGGFYETVTGLPLNVDEFSTTPVNLFMNIFEPDGDTLSQRPLIIICFGGGFVAGSKDHWSMRLLAQELAKRGFVTAVIDYRLGMNIFDEELSKRAVYRGVQDGRSAVRFFRADAAGANVYRIDPNHIYIGGHSAGAFVALHNAYMENEAERPASTYQWTQGCGFLDLSTCSCPDLGCLDCVGNNTNYSGHAKAVFSLAGAVGDVNYLEDDADPHVVLFHSTDDDTVPYDSGEPFSGISWAVVGDDLPEVFGSLPISNRAVNISLPYNFYSYTDRGHSVHEATSSALYSNIVPDIADFFYESLLKPAYHNIIGKQNVCSTHLIQQYHTDINEGVYYDWQVGGGTILSGQSTDTITIQWDDQSTVHTINVTPYSVWDAKGDSDTLHINIDVEFTNIWTDTGLPWDNPTAWSLQEVPDTCHHVVIPDHTIPTVLTLPSDFQTIIRSLYVGDFIQLTVPPSTLMLLSE